MLGYWLSVGSPKYVSMEAGQDIAFISDIGATFLKPLFIAGSVTMVVVFDLAFISERWLRHTRRLTPSYNKTETILSVFAIFFAIVGAAGLIFLTIFDTRHYPQTHDDLLVVFIGGYIIASIFVCAEYQRLGIHNRDHWVLRMSFWIKLAFIVIEVVLAIAFAVTGKYGKENIAGVLEWIIALIYIFWVWSFIPDFWPATRTRYQGDRFPNTHVRKGTDPNSLSTQENGSMTGGPVYTNGGSDMRENDSHYQPAGRNF